MSAVTQAKITLEGCTTYAAVSTHNMGKIHLQSQKLNRHLMSMVSSWYEREEYISKLEKLNDILLDKLAGGSNEQL